MQRRTAYLLIAVAAAAIAGVALDAPQPPPAEAPPRAPAAGEQRSALLALLPGRSAEPRGDLFATRSSWVPAVTPAPQAVAQAASPVPPPMPYRFVGHLASEGRKQHFLMKGDVLVAVNEGDILEGSYRVEALAPEEVTLLYVPLGVLTQLALASPVDHRTSLAQTPSPAPNAASLPRVDAASQTPVSTTLSPQGGRALPSELNDLQRTAAPGTRATHLRRERWQQLPPIGATTP